MVQAGFPSAEIHCFPNKGMDVLPFLRLLPVLKCRNYSLVCKLHTKRGVEPLGSVWRQHLISSLVGNRRSVQTVLKAFSENPDLMMAGPSNLYVSAKLVMYKNRSTLEQLNKILCPESRMPEDWGFFAGSMFWARIDSLLPIASAAEQLSRQWQADLGGEGNSDGGFAHAVERAFGWAA
jgi:lipopolysaccharide biosynthesis protein